MKLDYFDALVADRAESANVFEKRSMRGAKIPGSSLLSTPRFCLQTAGSLLKKETSITRK